MKIIYQNQTPEAVIYLDQPKPKSKRDFASLAEQLHAHATQFPDVSDYHAGPVVFNCDGFKVKCQPNEGAILALAERIGKGIPRLKTWTTPKLPSIKPYTEKEKTAVVEKYLRQAEAVKISGHAGWQKEADELRELAEAICATLAPETSETPLDLAALAA